MKTIKLPNKIEMNKMSIIKLIETFHKLHNLLANWSSDAIELIDEKESNND